MKNLLLLFVLGFALFWVGCEKEAMIQLEGKLTIVAKQEPQLLNPSVRVATAEDLEQFGTEDPAECCTVVDYIRYGENASGTEITFDLIVVPSELDESDPNDPQAYIDVRFNNGGNFAYLANFTTEVCDPNPNSVQTAYVLSYAMSKQQFSCPWILDTKVRLAGVNSMDQYVECTSREFRGYLSEFFDPEYVQGERCEADGVSTGGPGSSDCYDDNGNPIPC